MVKWWFWVVGLDSDWIPENERDGCVGVSLESQTTNPNHQKTNSRENKGQRPNIKYVLHYIHCISCNCWWETGANGFDTQGLKMWCHLK